MKEAKKLTHGGWSTGTIPGLTAKVRAKAWWPASAPMNITPQTKWTIAPPLPDPPHTNTHSPMGWR